MSKELEKAGLPVALVSAMYPVAEQVRANRIVKGVSIPHPCGDPSLPQDLDAAAARDRSDCVESARIRSHGTDAIYPKYGGERVGNYATRTG
jgi:glycine/betaine/sarcosine/D-proline reductase family selenoprotein B